jgi:26S proteasome regulatory subunit N1
MDSNIGLQRKALDEIKNEVSVATSSMTSVPKPLKYMRPHYDTIKEFYHNK